MYNIRFTLEKYDRTRKNRYTCPQCGKKKEFTRYIDTEGKIRFPENVGKCNRINSCGYHYTPKQYFEDHPQAKENWRYRQNYYDKSKIINPATQIRKIETSFIEDSKMKQSLNPTQWARNNLYLFLCKKIGVEITKRVMEEYKVGTAKKWGNSTVFWQIDQKGRVHTGKIMLYNFETGKRVKEPMSYITWVHSELKLKDFNLEQCFFGEHLLNSNKKIVCIVESEKTALIASAYFPNYIWISTGGIDGCFNKEHTQVLKDKQIYLFPDLGAWDRWNKKFQELKEDGMDIKIFDTMEKLASNEDKAKGLDIADYLLKEKISNSLESGLDGVVLKKRATNIKKIEELLTGNLMCD